MAAPSGFTEAFKVALLIPDVCGRFGRYSRGERKDYGESRHGAGHGAECVPDDDRVAGCIGQRHVAQRQRACAGAVNVALVRSNWSRPAATDISVAQRRVPRPRNWPLRQRRASGPPAGSTMDWGTDQRRAGTGFLRHWFPRTRLRRRNGLGRPPPGQPPGWRRRPSPVSEYRGVNTPSGVIRNATPL